MLECINTKCENSINGKCTNTFVKSNSDCLERVKTTKTLSYAEEQLEHAKEKEHNHCYNKKCAAHDEGYCLNKSAKCDFRMNKLPVVYKEECKKLKAENENLNIIIKGKEDVERENEEHEQKIKELENTIDGLQGEVAEYILKCGDNETEIKELKQGIEDREKAFTDAAEEIKKLKIELSEKSLLLKNYKDQLFNTLLKNNEFIHGEYSLVCRENRALKNALNNAENSKGDKV